VAQGFKGYPETVLCLIISVRGRKAVRKPVVAGSWYAGSAGELRRQIEDCFQHSLGPGALPGVTRTQTRRILGLVSPHAGYPYSGPVASHGFLQIASEPTPRILVILGPNHSGMGTAIALSNEDRWQTQLQWGERLLRHPS